MATLNPPAVELECCDEDVVEAATKDDLVRALERKPRNEDWYLSLTRSDDDYMEASLREDGTFQVDREEKGRSYTSASVVDEALLASLFTSFLEGDDSWSRQCQWEEPPPAKPDAAPSPTLKAVLPVVGVIVVAIALFVMGMGEWIAVLFALAFPSVIAFAIVSKVREVQRAATWTEGSARIVRSELITEARKAEGEVTRTVTVPRVEYEFSVGFDKYRGGRISIGEIMPNTPQVQAALKRYSPGASVPVYYNPADPKESVLERELPMSFGWIWAFVVVFTVLCVGAALWFVGVLGR